MILANLRSPKSLDSRHVTANVNKAKHNSNECLVPCFLLRSGIPENASRMAISLTFLV